MLSDFAVDGESRAGVGRRTLLESAVVLIAAGATSGPAHAQPVRPLVPARDAFRRRQVGFVLSHEQFTAAEFIEFRTAAEQAGSALVSSSDHFQPWQSNEDHSGMAWIALSALGQRAGREDQRRVIDSYGARALRRLKG